MEKLEKEIEILYIMFQLVDGHWKFMLDLKNMLKRKSSDHYTLSELVE